MTSSDCDAEPIRIPGHIQPLGHLLAFSGSDLGLAYASAGSEAVLTCGSVEAAFELSAERILALKPLDKVVAALSASATPAWGQILPLQSAAGDEFQATVHTVGDLRILEVETVSPEDMTAADVLYPTIRQASVLLERGNALNDLCAAAAEAIRSLTEFERVVVYRFDHEGHGIVLAENKSSAMPSLFGLRFPAGDIPRQARALYVETPHRFVAAVDYDPVPVLAAPDRAGQPLDLSRAGLRSLSPFHRDYVRAMGCGSSMSFSIIRAGSLWGMISCHSRTPHHVPPVVRGACDLISQMLAVRLAAIEEARHAGERAKAKFIEGRLLARMTTAAPLDDALTEEPDDLLGLVGATGAAVLMEGGCIAVGSTPKDADIRRIAACLAERGAAGVFHTSRLADEIPPLADLAERASGIIAVPVSRLHASYIIWFRPEVVTTFTWAGDPRTAHSGIGPQRSFDAWQEIVRRRAQPWSAASIDAARDLQTSIVGIVLRQAEEMAAMTDRLRQSNRDLAAFSYSVSHDLRAPFRHISGFAEMALSLDGPSLSERGRRCMGKIQAAAVRGGDLVDALLAHAELSRIQLIRVPVNMTELVKDVILSLEPEYRGRDIKWAVTPRLPEVQGDPVMLRQAMSNLLLNAIKYTRGRTPAVISIDGCTQPDHLQFVISDNGVGFPSEHAHRLFGVFARLHRAEDFEGIGIGLANVRRAIERHGGRVWASGEPDVGAKFHIILPQGPMPPSEDALGGGESANA